MFRRIRCFEEQQTQTRRLLPLRHPDHRATQRNTNRRREFSGLRQNLHKNLQWGTSHLGSRPNRSSFILRASHWEADPQFLPRHLEALARRIGVQAIFSGPVGEPCCVCHGNSLARGRVGAGLGIGLERDGPNRRQSRRGGCTPPVACRLKGTTSKKLPSVDVDPVRGGRGQRARSIVCDVPSRGCGELRAAQVASPIRTQGWHDGTISRPPRAGLYTS